MSTNVLNGWTKGSFTAAGITHDTFRKGSGPLVVVVHEVPGITPKVAAFAEEVVSAGFTVVMPDLVGTPGKEMSNGYAMSSLAKVCVSKEFTAMARNKTSPIIGWLRALGRSLHQEIGGKGIGAVGMCFSGGFALGMMLDDHMLAPVLSQPSLPFPMGAERAADLNLSPDDALVVKRRADEGCQVLGLRFTGDRLVGTRFDSLRKLLGDAFIAIELPSSKKTDHSVLTEQRDEPSVLRVISFFREKLH
jgi:dienelactone hydrolase